MTFPIYIDAIGLGVSIMNFKGSQVNILYNDVFLSLKVVLI